MNNLKRTIIEINVEHEGELLYFYIKNDRIGINVERHKVKYGCFIQGDFRDQ